MAPDDHFPPPGDPVAGPPQETTPWGAGGTGGVRPAGPVGPGTGPGAAHKPGAVPLRPLRLGDMYDGAFKIIRYNPRATVGAAVLVAAAAMVIPVVVTAVLSTALDLSLGPPPSTGSTQTADLEDAAEYAVGVLGSLGALTVGLVAQSFGLILVTGMVAHVTMAAAIGRRLSLGEAWQATYGSRWRLIGLVVLIGVVSVGVVGVYTAIWVVLVVTSGEVLVLVVWGVLSLPALLALAVWAWTRLTHLAVPALMLEQVGVLAAVGRAFALTRRQFWRTFGIALLTTVITQVVASVLALPFTLLSQGALLVPAFGDYQLLVLVIAQALATIVSAAFVSPFTAAVASLQYVDQRMRKEAFDVELMARAGVTAP